MHVHNFLGRSRRATGKLTTSLGRAPTDEELADELGVPTAKLRKMNQGARRQVSLEMPKGRRTLLQSESETLRLSDTLTSTGPTAEDCVELSLLHSELASVFEELGDDERRVVEMRFGLVDGRSRTCQEVANAVRADKEWVRRTETRALRKMRRPHHQQRLHQYVDTLEEIDDDGTRT